MLSKLASSVDPQLSTAPIGSIIQLMVVKSRLNHTYESWL